jgi:hypothetical protein
MKTSKRAIAWTVLVAAALLSLSACAELGSSYRATATVTSSSEGSYRGRYTDEDVSIFYDQLSPYGRWIEYGSYGWVWTPYDVSVGWRPYTVGHWAYTEWGWTWVSDEPWGWAAYHYGRWAFDADYGWLWIPGEVWAPAWVAWRYGDDWVGWAPLPPRADWQVGVGLTVSDDEVDRSIEPRAWCFVRQRSMLDASLRDRIAPQPRNVTVMRQTRLIVRFGESAGRPVQNGLDVALIERGAGHEVPRLHVGDVDSPQRGGRRSGRTLQMFRPTIQTPAQRPPRRTPAEIGEPDVSDSQIQAERNVERQRIESDFASRRRRLQEDQDAELARPVDEATRDQLRQRHEQERQALSQQEQEERRILENRLQKKIVKPGRRGRPAGGRGRESNPG